jgi:hypothetical protein
MKTLVAVALFLFLLFPSEAVAGDLWFTPFTWYDYTLEATFLGVTSMDWSQTQEIASQPTIYHEMNPALGNHPSLLAVNIYFPASMAVHALVAYALPKPYREVWQTMWIGVETYCVVNNVSIGLRVRF